MCDGSNKAKSIHINENELQTSYFGSIFEILFHSWRYIFFLYSYYKFYVKYRYYIDFESRIGRKQNFE